MTSKDPELEYLAGLRRLLGEEAPFDPVKQVIRARLAGAREPVQGLVSPPLGRDDPDTSLLLLYLYDQLRFDQDEPAKERLRRAVVELLEEALTQWRRLSGNRLPGPTGRRLRGPSLGSVGGPAAHLALGPSRDRPAAAGRGTDRADRRRPDPRPADPGSLAGGHAALAVRLAGTLRRENPVVFRWSPFHSEWPEGPMPRPSDFPSVHPAVPRAPEARPGICWSPVPDPVPVGPRKPRGMPRGSGWPCAGSTASSWVRGNSAGVLPRD